MCLPMVEKRENFSCFVTESNQRLNQTPFIDVIIFVALKSGFAIQKTFILNFCKNTGK